MSEKGWKILKFVGIGLGIVGGVLSACSDGGELISSFKEIKKNPELPGPVSNEEEQ